MCALQIDDSILQLINSKDHFVCCNEKLHVLCRPSTNLVNGGGCSAANNEQDSFKVIERRGLFVCQRETRPTGRLDKQSVISEKSLACRKSNLVRNDDAANLMFLRPLKRLVAHPLGTERAGNAGDLFELDQMSRNQGLMQRLGTVGLDSDNRDMAELIAMKPFDYTRKQAPSAHR